MANANVIKTVAEAVKINRQIKALQGDLDQLKETIREEAEKVATLDATGKRFGKVEFESIEGTCTVAFPRDKVSLKKGLNPIELRGTTVSMEVWDNLFATKVVIGDEFEETFGELSKGAKKAVQVFIESKESTPTVTLPK